MTDLDEARIQQILAIRLDGCERWDVDAFVAEQRTKKEPTWAGETTGKQLDEYLAEADRRIAASAHDPKTATERHLAMRRNLYARAVQAGDIGTALRVLIDLAKLEGAYPGKTKGRPELDADGQTWILIGIPHARFGEIAGEIELLKCVDGIRVEVAGGESKILDMAP
jgi:hypothetical protein